MTESICAKVKAATGWPDNVIAEIIGVSRTMANAYVTGRAPEHLNGDQRRALVESLKDLAGAAGDVVTWIELVA